jgi:hypothetical protein
VRGIAGLSWVRWAPVAESSPDVVTKLVRMLKLLVKHFDIA